MNLTKKLYKDFKNRINKNKDLIVSVEGTGKEGRSVQAMKLQELNKNFNVIGCNHFGVEVLSEVYDSKKFATQKNKCVNCEKVLTVKVFRPTIREQQEKQKQGRN